MSLFDVIFNRHEKFSSDVTVGTTPVEGATVVDAVHQADVARVEAETPEAAVAAVQVAYSGHTSGIEARAVPAETEPVAVEPEPTVEPVVAEQTVETAQPTTETAPETEPAVTV